jgi:hypothetical protein
MEGLEIVRAKGITYDTGFLGHDGYSRKSFDEALVDRELRIIRDDLHCTAVRIIGGGAQRLGVAATIAAGLGLEVWFSPYPLELTTDEMLSLFRDCAERAEQLRLSGAEVVFVTGAEISLMNTGFLPGKSLNERVQLLTGRPANLPKLIAGASAGVNDFLGVAVAAVRERFGGRITYASVQLERVHWTLFDITSVDLYRSAEIAHQLAAGVRTLVGQGRPVAITEFGSATFRGAGDVGARGLEIVEYIDDRPFRLKDDYDRDEGGQATYVRELLEIFDVCGVDSCFVFLFALYGFPHRPNGDPRDDLDLASYGIVKVFEDRRGETYPDLPWEPKAAFRAVAEYYRAH